MEYLVFNSIIDDIRPSEDTMDDCPTDRLPFGIGNNHRQCSSNGDGVIDGILRIVVDRKMQSPLFGCLAVDNLLDIYLEELRKLGNGFNIRFGFAVFPTGNGLTCYVKCLCKLILCEAFFFAQIFDGANMNTRPGILHSSTIVNIKGKGKQWFVACEKRMKSDVSLHLLEIILLLF